MGGSRQQSSTKVIKPTLTREVTRYQDIANAAAYLQKMRQETNQTLASRYATVGTPAELGARMAGQRALESAAYLSSLPQGDKYMQALTGSSTDHYAPLKEQASTLLSNAQADYAKARENAAVAAAPYLDESYFPDWGKDTIKAGMPKRMKAAPAQPSAST